MFDKKLYIDTFSKIHAPEETLSEVLKMTKRKNNHALRFTRLIVIAAIITATLATTAFAYAGFTQYENPMQMLKVFFGGDEYYVDEGFSYTETYYDQIYNYVVATEEHIPINTKVAEEDVAPFISDVGKSISYGDYTLTIEAHLYDSATGCGCIYYKLENPNGITDYELQYNGEVFWPKGEKVNIQNCHGRNYIVADETTDTTLSVAHYYCGSDADYLTVSFYLWIIGEPGSVTEEHWKEFEANNQKLILPLDDGGGMNAISIADGLFQISPIAMKFKISELPFLGYYESDGKYCNAVDNANIWNLAIRYHDGTEYVIERNEPYTINFTYALGDYTYMYYTFNRLIDVENIEAIVINDVEFVNVTPLSEEQRNQIPEFEPQLPSATEPANP